MPAVFVSIRAKTVPLSLLNKFHALIVQFTKNLEEKHISMYVVPNESRLGVLSIDKFPFNVTKIP